MSEPRYRAQRGMADIMPPEIRRWQRLQQTFASVLESWGYDEIRTPILEDYDLFVRSSGETSEVVNKQMYEFFDKGERRVALRPEGTAGVMRACIEHKALVPGQPLRLWYFNQHFRYERPQKGRMRQHHQLGLELIGSPSPLADAEVIEVIAAFLRTLGLKDLRISINSIGRSDTRQRFREALLSYLHGWLGDQDADTREKARANPLRLFDSKSDSVQEVMAGAPLVTDYLEDSSRRDFELLQNRLDQAEIPYVVDPRIVRGLDYYTDTVFEIQSTGLGAQTSVCGGGRYDGLIEGLGGPSTPSVGAGMGVERILLVMESLGIASPAQPNTVFVAAMGEEARSHASALAAAIRSKGSRAMVDLDGRTIKQQFKQADRFKANWVIVLGDDEIKANTATIKNMATAEQKTVSLPEAIAAVTA